MRSLVLLLLSGAMCAPAFSNSDAPAPDVSSRVAVNVVADDLPALWALEVLPDGELLATAKNGQMLIVSTSGKPVVEIDGVPEVDARGQGGLLDLALSPDFANDSTVFFSYSEPRESGNGTTVAKARLDRNDNGGQLQDVQVIFRQTPAYRGNAHFGSRLVFAPDGNLFVTVGDRSDSQVRGQAQELGSGLGKVFRITADGQPANGNPFIGTEGALPEIWSYGHRNTQAATIDADGDLWIVEHGPRGGDELNQPQAGLNYGWPIVTYGLEYSGAKIGDGQTAADGMEPPVYYWTPVIGPSGMVAYQGDEFPEWNDAFLIGGLVSRGIVVLHVQDNKVVTEERIPLETRVRDVTIAPDGSIYAIAEQRGGPGSILQLRSAP
ncbi:PQQ-dependent sugar dehydrogenase [Aureimonas fodinaquatilis]|uniref:PQQ-dependent sugar dehydrogenase n=1 Tax=Aureimonas fodinaquatilis TaxID=2565783 RepID=A0A5B0DTG2_9HYPH|nr:PQQ-dependent sugar dehydrogenase [Aureimonas fodinaquatilis]KAA0968449.1 PQQ-dependent sugar dehydrogenase [Aureimonas fodinaquatilis]